MIKIIGATFILCASVCSCYFYERKQKARLQELISVYEFIKYIKTQIEHFSTPIKKIYSSYESESESVEVIKNGDYKTLGSLLEKDEYKLIYEFFSRLGAGLKGEELSLCGYTLEELEAILKKRREDYPNKIKVFRAMALFIGFCVIILLI